MRISDTFQFAINFTIRISKVATPLTIIFNTAETVGKSNAKIIFIYPTTKIKATNGKAIIVQRQVNGVIV